VLNAHDLLRQRQGLVSIVSFVPTLRYSATGSKPKWGAIHYPVTRTPSPTVPIAESELHGQPDELRMSTPVT
jgi:hypothetical protein